jgi:hypothetical protein
LDDLRAFKFEEDFREKLSSATLISRQYKYACPLFAAVYVALQLLIGMKSGFCDANAEPYQPRTVYFYYSAGFSFFMYAVQTTGKIYETAVQGIDQAAVGIYCCALTESLIASSSALITAYWGYGGVCTDALGAQSPCAQVTTCTSCVHIASGDLLALIPRSSLPPSLPCCLVGQWAEWLCSVPLLLYMSVAIEDKPALTLKDIVVIGSVVLTVACGFFMNTPGLSPSGAIVLFIAGCFFLGLCMFLGVITQKREERVFDDEDYAKETLARDTQFLAQSAKKRALSRLVILLMPLFPLVNILQYTHVFDRDEGFIAYELLGVVAKLLFLSTMSDAHISLSQTVSILRLSAEEAANATRRTFLRYVSVRIHAPSGPYIAPI